MNDSYFYGLHTVLSTLETHPTLVRQLFLQSERLDAPLQKIQTLARAAKIPVQTIPKQKLDQLAKSGVHQGVAILLKEIPTLTEKDLPALLDDLKEPPFLLVLDEVQDPHNLGACLRSANAAGVHAVIVPKNNSASLTPVACKAASGAAMNTPLISVTNLARTLDYLKKREIWVYGASGDVTQTLYCADLKGAIAWVMGSESDGLRRLTQETCDALFSIPMQGNVSSLNVSVATGICLFEAVRQRSRSS